MANNERVRPAEPLFVPASGPIDLENEEEKKHLEASSFWVRKARIEEDIREKYCLQLRTLASCAKPRTALKQDLEDYAIAAARATSAKLIDRHTQEWGKKITKARLEAKHQLAAVEKSLEIIMKEVGERPRDLNDHGRIEGRASTRYDKACECHEKAAALVKDLKLHLATEV